MNEGTLFVVATPIGNLDDISPRALEVLRSVDLVAAEDTRVTGRLLSHFGIETPQMSLHEHNESERTDRVLALLKKGSSVALVSDAGTPLISDPGYRLVGAARREGTVVSPIPGPSAVSAALSAASLPTDRWTFEGFLPSRAGKRREALAALASEPRTLVFFESVHRIAATLNDLASVFGGDRSAFIARELTKLHEQCIDADLDTLCAMLADGRIPMRGEFVVVVAGNTAEAVPGATPDVDRLLTELARELPASKAAGVAARITGQQKNALYRRLQALKAEETRASR